MLRFASSVLLRRTTPQLLLKSTATPVVVTTSVRNFTALEDSKTAHDAWKKSCYVEIDYTIPEEESVFEAVRRFSAYNIGALVTTDGEGNLSGIITERDFVTKIGPDDNMNTKGIKIKEVYTAGEKLVTATPHDEIGECMNKILKKDIRHLPLLGDDGKSVVGMISVKDLVKVTLDEKQKMIDTLSNFALGKGGHYIED